MILNPAYRDQAHAAMREWSAAELLPGTAMGSPAGLDRFCSLAASTHHHPCGTCRMGLDALSVVDPDLKLRGLDNLYVVDASVFPSLPSGPINAAVVAVAEQWCVNWPTGTGGT